MLSSPFVVPATGTYFVAVYFSGSATRPAIASSARSYRAGDPAVQNDLTGWTEDTSGVPAVRWTEPGTTGSMVLVTAPQTTDATVSTARLLLEYDNSASPALNTDLVADVACKLNSATVTITIASPGVVSHTAHGLVANDPVSFTTTGALPTGLVAGTVYVVKTVVNANSYTLAATPGGSAIVTSGSQSGTHSANAYQWSAASLSAVSAFGQNGRKIAETADVNCAAGTSFVARIRTFNSKNVPVHGVTVSVK